MSSSTPINNEEVRSSKKSNESKENIQLKPSNTGHMMKMANPPPQLINSLFSPSNGHSSNDLDDLQEKHQSSKKDFIAPDDDQFDYLMKKMQKQILSHQGECIYVLGEAEHEGEETGLAEDDLVTSRATLEAMAENLNCKCTLIRGRDGQVGKIEEYLIRRIYEENDFLEVKVAVVGNVDAGKSTLLGVLTHCELDNGRGYSRQKLFRHKHEIESGRTSSVGNEILGFSSNGQVVNKASAHGNHIDWSDICQKSAKVITFVDLAGHEKYLKTTVFGMTGHLPDFCMLMVGSNAGIIGTTKEHLGLALALNVPVFVVVTKIDMCPVNVLQETLKLLIKILKSPGCRKIPVLVSDDDNVITTANNFTSERVCPIFQISNVTGENIHLLKKFLNLLKCRTKFSDDELPEFLIDDTFSVPGVGTVVSGTLIKGVITAGDSLLLGPDLLGKFETVVVKSIHRKRMAVNDVRAGQTAAFALKKIKRSSIRKGMVMLHPKLNPKAVWEYKGEILVLHHPTTISAKYQAMVHCGSIRQTASILTMSKQHLRTGDKAEVRFRFMKNPEYLRIGTKFVFREGRTKAVGTILEIVENAPAYQSHLKRNGKRSNNKTANEQQQNGETTTRRGGRRWKGPQAPNEATTVK